MRRGWDSVRYWKWTHKKHENKYKSSICEHYDLCLSWMQDLGWNVEKSECKNLQDIHLGAALAALVTSIANILER